jgi:hypothetical protein
LRAGKTAEAASKLQKSLPDLVRKGELRQVDDVAGVLRHNSDSLHSTGAIGVGRSAVNDYFAGLGEDVSDVPLDKICDAVLNGQPAPFGVGETLKQHFERQRQRDSLKTWCNLLGVF